MSPYKDKCLVCGSVCGSGFLEVLCRMVSLYCPNIFRRVAICQNCGHIQVYPIFDQNEYAVINKHFFDKKYLREERQNPDNVKKENRLSERLSSYIREGLNVLDIGAGEGWAMAYFRKNNCNYFAIEAVDRLAEAIAKRGATVIGKSLFDDYRDYEHFFDIVIFRHILEHMPNPSEALSKAKRFLNSDGIIYLALPNAANSSVRKGFRTSYLRPVHISYFCQGNVLRLAQRLGLKAIYSQANEELFFLLKHGRDNSLQSCNHYEQQKKHFRDQHRKAFWFDNYRTVRFVVKNIGDIFLRTLN